MVRVKFIRRDIQSPAEIRIGYHLNRSRRLTTVCMIGELVKLNAMTHYFVLNEVIFRSLGLTRRLGFDAISPFNSLESYRLDVIVFH
jgi:hypothetical protein